MADLVIIFAASLTLLYGVMTMIFVFGFWVLKRKRVRFQKNSGDSVKISLIAAFRNEANNLPPFLDALASQSYPVDLYEIILVNDHSEDDGFQVALEWAESKTNARILSLPAEYSGKKAALELALSNCRYELVCATDADTVFGANFLKTQAAHYCTGGGNLLLLPVVLHETGFWNKMQAAEFISLTASAAGSTGAGIPILSNGAGMLFEKHLASDFKSRHASGDDMFLLHSAKADTETQIEYVLDRDALVYAAGAPGLKDFFNQRRRWVSKFGGYTDAETILAGLVVFGINLFLVLTLFLSLFYSEYWFYLALFFSVKVTVDTVLVVSALHFFKKMQLLPYYFLWILIYPFYALTLALWGVLGKSFEWKHRRWRS